MNQLSPENYQPLLMEIKQRIRDAQYTALKQNAKLAPLVREIGWTKEDD